MQFIVTPGGDEVAIMKAAEVLVMERAMSRYVLENSDSNIAVRVLRELASANESREARMEEEIERTCT
ncbi:hypothetical protein [Streptomyces sp. CFMR 7]|uniref:hypothetical protein n=1 Tax=Streptomyces sp. CFMR 7 TaxID=1649184 RepID=UPI0011A3ACF8|nr:hypothetical protein [Streptomyces sp. CFMR 7]